MPGFDDPIMQKVTVQHDDVSQPCPSQNPRGGSLGSSSVLPLGTNQLFFVFDTISVFALCTYLHDPE